LAIFAPQVLIRFMTYKLIIGNKNYSSWSLRPWMMLKGFNIPFEEQCVKFNSEEFVRVVPAHSPTGLVPILIDGDVIVWDSLAIGEYLAEKHAFMWPGDTTQRAIARCFCAEMHSGFTALRSRMPMNVRRNYPVTPEPAVAKNIARIEAIWTAARRRAKSNGPYLFGAFSIVDAYFAPVVWRFNTYEVKLNPVCQEYMQTMLAHPAMKEWETAARLEAEVEPHEEPEYIYGKPA
jgi:glutathione S-transferase